METLDNIKIERIKPKKEKKQKESGNLKVNKNITAVFKCNPLEINLQELKQKCDELGLTNPEIKIIIK